jgi:hypothetical protein
MAVTLTLFIVDKENMGEFYKPSYATKLEFLQAFADARYDNEAIHNNAFQVMAEPPISQLKPFILYSFIGRLFIGGEIEGENEEGKKVLLDYYPETLRELEIAMIVELAKTYQLDSYNEERGWPLTKLEQLKEWMLRNKGKEIAVVYA